MGRRLKLVAFKAGFRLAIAFLILVCWLDDRIRFRFPFARDITDLKGKRDWCIDVLRRAGALPAGAEVTGFAVTPFRGDQAFRSTLARVEITYQTSEETVAFRCVAKFAPTSGSLRDRAVYILQENHSKEIGFYRHLAPTAGKVAPRAYFAESSRLTGHFCLLLEWVGDGIEYAERESCPVPGAQLALTHLAQLHGAHWNLERAGSEWMAPVPEVVIDFFASLIKGEDHDLFAEILGLCWRHNGQAPQTVIHGDPRVGNMIFPAPDGGGRFALLDWQCVRKGKSAFDVAYLLAVSLEPAIRAEQERALLRFYHEAIRAEGVTDYDFGTLCDDYRFAVLLVLALLDLPFLVAEANVDDENADAFEDVRVVWFDRLAHVITGFDYEWLAQHCRYDAGELKRAFLESLARKRAAQTAPVKPPAGTPGAE